MRVASHLGLRSDRGDSNPSVARREKGDVSGVVAEDYPSTKPDCCRNDKRVDGEFAASTHRRKKVARDSGSARTRGHYLGNATRQD